MNRTSLLPSGRFGRFLLVGSLAAAVNLVAGIVLRTWLEFTVAAAIAYVAGMAAAFVLNRLLVFAGAVAPVHVQAAWFAVVNLAGLAQTVLIGLLFVRVLLPALDWSWYPETVAHAIGISVPVFTSYFGHKYLSFRGARAGYRSSTMSL